MSSILIGRKVSRAWSLVPTKPWCTMAKVGAFVLVALLLSCHLHAFAEVAEKLPPPPSTSCENPTSATAGTFPNFCDANAWATSIDRG